MQLSHTRHEVHTIDCRFMTFVLAYFCALARPGWQAPAAPGFLPKVLALRSVFLPRHEPYSGSCASFETSALPSLAAVDAVRRGFCPRCGCGTHRLGEACLTTTVGRVPPASFFLSAWPDPDAGRPPP